MEKLLNVLHKFNQDHILQQIPNLSITHPIFKQLQKIDLNSFFNNIERAKNPLQINTKNILTNNIFHSNDTDLQTKISLQNIGFENISQSNVAVIILSGGQGTRYGSLEPKGMSLFGISKKSIFQLHIEKITKMRLLTFQKYGLMPNIPIYIMTSEINNKAIKEFFALHNYFGYPVNDVFFFEQGLEICISLEGKIIIESPISLSLSPNGNGGIYDSLFKSGAIFDMKERHIKHLHIYSIDNILTKSLDPIFLGLCIKNQVELGNKVVWKNDVDEKVGITVSINNNMHVLEYSEVPNYLSNTLDENSKIIHGAANICNHYMSLEFLIKNMTSNNYHIVYKKIPYMDPITCEMIIPTANNGIKLEMFIFDIFHEAKRWIIMEVERKKEFAPIKNGPGHKQDSPDSALKLLSDECKEWLLCNGAILVNENDLCEISPLMSLNGEGLEPLNNIVIELPCYLE
jgi:UDP-N-acetylglucosamine/UDP-N-acetylgalactosamine diphosphorylase